MTRHVPRDYTSLSLADVADRVDELVRDALATFADLEPQQLNWRPDSAQWSVAQCFEHLVTANRLVLQSAREALDPARPRSVWQRVPFLPGILGRALIRSQAPGGTRKFTAPSKARPASSNIADDIVQRFVEQHVEAVVWMRRLDERKASGTIMSSPFVRVVTYSVLDGCRLIVAHDRRHLEQARRVTTLAGFPRGQTKGSPDPASCGI